MFRLVKAETIPATLELAEHYRSLKPWAGERNLDKARVKHLAGKREKGLLVPFQWASARLPDGTYVRINAQHSSEMLCQSDGQFPEGAMIQVSEFEVDELKDVALLFRQYDDRKSSRSPIEISGAYQGLHEPLHGVDRKNAKLALEGHIWHRKFVEKLGVPVGDDIYEWFEKTELHPFLIWVSTDILVKKAVELRVEALLGAIYATYSLNPEEAQIFWLNVARTFDLDDEGHPAQVLDIWLQGAGDKDNGHKLMKLAPANYYQGAIYAWNAFRHNRSIKDIRYDARKGWLDVER
jgi:hypothetical protein